MSKHPLQDIIYNLSSPAFQLQVKDSLSAIHKYYCLLFTTLYNAELCQSITSKQAAAGAKSLLAEVNRLLLSAPPNDPAEELRSLQIIAQRLSVLTEEFNEMQFLQSLRYNTPED